MASNPKAEVEISAHSRNLAAKLREARSKFASFGSELKKNIFGKDLIEKGFWGKGGAQLVGNLGSSAISGLGSILFEQGKAVAQYNDGLVRLQINGNATAEQIAAMDGAIRRASDATGLSKASALEAARSYVALTGDISGAEKSVESWTRAAQASGSSVSDIASTAQALRDNLKIDPSQMEQAFDIMIGQGKKGAVEMSELKNQLAIVSPLMAEFAGGKSLQGLSDLSASIQVVRKGFGGTEETITGVQSLMTALIKNAARFQKAGVHVMDVDPVTGKKSLKSFREIIDAIGESRLMKDPTKLEKAFGRVEAYRAYLQLRDNKAELDQLAESAQYAGTTQRDLGTYTQSTAGKTALALERAKNAMAEAFTPERIKAFSEALVKAVELFGKIVGYIDRTAKFVDDVVNKVRGPSVDDKADSIVKHVIAEDKKNPISRAQRAALAKQYSQEAANLNQKGFSTDLTEDEQVRMTARRRMGEYYREQSDQWGAGNGVEGPSIDTKQIEQITKGTKLTPGDVVQMQASDFAYQMRIALRDAFRDVLPQLDKKPIQVNVDSAKIVDAHRGSSAHARRPGG